MDLATRPKHDAGVLALFMQAIQDLEAAGAEIVMNVSITVRRKTCTADALPGEILHAV